MQECCSTTYLLYTLHHCPSHRSPYSKDTGRAGDNAHSCYRDTLQDTPIPNLRRKKVYTRHSYTESKNDDMTAHVLPGN